MSNRVILLRRFDGHEIRVEIDWCPSFLGYFMIVEDMDAEAKDAQVLYRSLTDPELAGLVGFSTSLDRFMGVLDDLFLELPTEVTSLLLQDKQTNSEAKSIHDYIYTGFVEHLGV